MPTPKQNSAIRRYIVTHDVEYLVTKWCNDRNLKAPRTEFFKDLSDQFEHVIRGVFRTEDENHQLYPALRNDESWVPTEPIFFTSAFITKKISKLHSADDSLRDRFWVTLDRVHTDVGDDKDADFCMDVTRIYDPDGCVKIGLGIRPESKHQQKGQPLDSIARACFVAVSSSKHKGKDIVLVDDGLYSGGTMADAVHALHRRGVRVCTVITALARQEGHHSLVKKFAAIKEADSSFHIPDQDVGRSLAPDIRDWVCERDFFFGVPFSGRTAGYLAEGPVALRVGELAMGIPYSCVSTNDLSDCAGIQGGAHSLSKACLQLSRDLWRYVEQLNKEQLNKEGLSVSQFSRVPYPLNVDPAANIVAALDRRLADCP